MLYLVQYFEGRDFLIVTKALNIEGRESFGEKTEKDLQRLQTIKRKKSESFMKQNELVTRYLGRCMEPAQQQLNDSKRPRRGK